MENNLGKLLIVAGLLIAGVGLYMTLGGKFNLIGRLPGDIRIERDNFTLFFPLGTCLLVSALISLFIWFIKR